MMRRKSGEEQPMRVLLEFFFPFYCFSFSFPLSCRPLVQCATRCSTPGSKIAEGRRVLQTSRYLRAERSGEMIRRAAKAAEVAALYLYCR